MSRVTKAYRNEPRRSNSINKEKRGVPSQRTSDRTSDRSSKSDSPTEGETCNEYDMNLENNLSDSLSQKFSTTLGTVGEECPDPVAHKFWNVGLGDSSIHSPKSPPAFFCKTPMEHPVDSNGRPSLRIMIPTLSTSDRRVDELPIAPAIPNGEHPWGHKHGP